VTSTAPTPVDVLLLVLEILTWVGLVPGILLLILGYLRRAFAARFEETWGVIIASPAGTEHPWFRWMDTERTLQSAPVPLDSDSGSVPEIGDEVRVYFDRRDPEHGRLDHPASDGRVLRVLGWVLTGVGAAAGIAQLAVMLAT